SNQLSHTGHPEDWFRINLYSFVWDGLYLKEDKFVSKRSEYHSTITKDLNEHMKNKVPNQIVDFALHSENCNLHLLTVEERRSIKCVSSDIGKGKLMQA
ncbi:uncharacterized protein EV154DRAFT_432868, partial [Mucor mucedo]|uniref:uncharacterized protein n=1 Tax=Mucor mucedo TaxID=29922 RepID=UPI00221F0595